MSSLTRSTCPYCGVGCGVLIESQAGRIVDVRGDPDHPANFGRLCTKGSTLALTADQVVTRMTRLLQPMQRSTRGAAPAPIDWDAALDQMVDRFGTIIERDGPDAVAFYLSGQLLTEDYYVFNKLAKGLVGTNNLDTNSRLCMSSAVAGYKQSLGVDAPPACYEDIDHADLIVITGSNAAIAHPILFRRIEDARKANPALRLITIDPRRTETAQVSDLHLPIQPGTDVALYHGILHVLIWEDRIDRRYIEAHTSGFAALRQRVSAFGPAEAARLCGIPVESLIEAARWFGQSRAALSMYCQGLNQSSSGTAKNVALINLHLATGQIGRAGAGPLSLTGQPNAMGGREVGGMANLLSGHRDLDNPADRDEVARLWGVPAIAARPGKTAVELFEAVADGQIKALWIACTNPAQSMPDQATVRRALQRAEYVVVQEAFAQTETAAYADLLLPAASWGEKEGTVTNSERRISRVRAAIAPAGAARPDWQIAADFARRLERRWQRDDVSLFAMASAPEPIWNEHRETTRGRDLDITGLSYALLEQAPRQWPFPAGAQQGKQRLYEDGCFATPDGRARFVDVAYRAPAETADARFPFSLSTGRLRDQWHGMSRTGTLGRLFGHVPTPVVQIHPQDLARRGLTPGEWVRVSSRRGAIVLPVAADDSVAPLQAWLPMHWGGQYLSGRDGDGGRLAGVNALTSPAFCPDSRQPELKHAAVRIERAALRCAVVGAAWLPQASAFEALQALRAQMAAFEAAICVPFGREPDAGGRLGVLFKAADSLTPPAALIALIEQALGLNDTGLLRYVDPHRAQHRVMRLGPPLTAAPGDDAHRLQGFLLVGDVSAQDWLLTLLQDQRPAQSLGRHLLRAEAQAPLSVAPRGRQICACLNVLEPQILAALDSQPAVVGSPRELQAQRLSLLQASLRCGTQCGSCLPELRRLIEQRCVVLSANASCADPAAPTPSTDLLLGELR